MFLLPWNYRLTNEILWVSRIQVHNLRKWYEVQCTASRFNQKIYKFTHLFTWLIHLIFTYWLDYAIWNQVSSLLYYIILYLFYFLLDILNSVLNSIQSDPKSWIFSTIICWITFYIVKFYYKVKQYPNGPLPLPLIGNFLCKNFNNFLFN